MTAYSHTYRYMRLGVGDLVALDPAGAPYSSSLDVPVGWTANLWYHTDPLASPFAQTGWVQTPAGGIPAVARVLAVQIEAAPSKTPSERVSLTVSSANYKAATGLRYTDSGGNRGVPFTGSQTFTLSLVHWEGPTGTDPGSDVDEIDGITWNYGIGTDDYRDFEALFGTTSLRITGPPNGAAYATGFADPSAGPWTAECFINANDGDAFVFFEIQRVLDTTAPDQTTAVVTMQLSMTNDNIVLTIRNTAGTEIETATPDTSHSPWPASPTNGWKHVAMTQDSNLFEIFFEGQRVYSQTVAGNDASIAAYGLIAGAPTSKHIEETRLSKTVRYTGATYTIPSAPFTVD
jgi:hypothetical protein